MNNDKTAKRNLDAVADEEPTAELEVPTEANFAATQALHDNFDESSSTARTAIEAQVKISELQSQLKQLLSVATKLAAETRAFKKLKDEIAADLEEATRRNAELTTLLSQRDEELAALKSALAAKEETAEKGDGLVAEAVDETQSPMPSQREFDSGETRKLVGHGDYSSHEIELRPGRMSLGSAGDNDISLDADFISRHHAQILSSSSETILRDMNSTNGTYVNSRKISRCALRDGDSIAIGKLRFTFVMQNGVDSADQRTAPTPTSEDSAHPDPGTWQ